MMPRSADAQDGAFALSQPELSKFLIPIKNLNQHRSQNLSRLCGTAALVQFITFCQQPLSEACSDNQVN
jgi:hypothetical protein